MKLFLYTQIKTVNYISDMLNSLLEFSNYVLSSSSQTSHNALLNHQSTPVNFYFASLVFSQVLILSIFFLLCVWYEDPNSKFDTYSRMTAMEVFVLASNTLDWYYAVLIIGGLINLFLLHFILIYIDLKSLYTHVIALLTYYSCLLLCYLNVLVFWFFLFLTIAANSMCDPLVRVFPAALDIVTQPNNFILIPQSEINEDDHRKLLLHDSDPYRNAICVVNTEYAERGRNIASVSVAACLISFTLTFIFFTVQRYSQSKQSMVNILLLNFIVIAMIQSGAQIILNDSVWDWRLFIFSSYTLIISVFNSCTVFFCSAYYMERSTFHAMSWIYLQIIDTIEQCLSILFYPETTSL